MAQPHDRRGRDGREPEPADLAYGCPQDRLHVRSGRGGGRGDQARGLRPSRRAVAPTEPGLPDHGPREGQPVQQVYREGRRNHHRRGLSGVEEGDTGIGRRRQRVGAAQVRADSERLFPQRRKREGDRRPRRDEEQFALHRAVAYGSRVPRAAVRDGGSRNLRLRSRRSSAYPANGPRWPSSRTTTGSIRSAPAWA